MKKLYFPILLWGLSLMACQQRSYPDLGENIYRTGRNLSGKHLLDKKNTSIRFIRSCQGCHGKYGQRIPHCDIRWSNLSRLPVPYTDYLFFRFLDKDLKSDGSRAKTGVHWAMTQEEQQAVLAFLKSL